MKIKKIIRLLIVGCTLTIVILSGCKKADDSTQENPDFSQNNGKFKDSRDGNIYKWIKIDNTIWMAENLKYTGDGIKHITNNDEWINNPEYDGWCYYDTNSNYTDTYGVLYQWVAAKRACPEGWHLPTDGEWTQMEDYLITHGYSYNSVIGDPYIAKSMATDYGWHETTQKGTVGNSDYANIRNKTGFSALPSGCRNSHDNGLFCGAGIGSYWWSSTELNSNNSYERIIIYSNVDLRRNAPKKSRGEAVRCVKN